MTTHLAASATESLSTRALTQRAARSLIACVALAAAACGGTEATSRGSAASLEHDGGDAAKTIAEACAAGFPQGDPAHVCNSTYGGKCFESDEAACACAGCGEHCLLLDSYPSQAVCENDSPPSGPSGSTSSDPVGSPTSPPAGSASPVPPSTSSGSPPNAGAASCAGAFARADSGAACQVVFGGACFATTDAACACAGCPSAKCLVLESFPEQVACQP
ncbi:MAG TPA: hypothetical protein VH142_02525 [Polyangiaceae bacterium]|nr:hypothetical protein [Polyangiaceae bacterium]